MHEKQRRCVDASRVGAAVLNPVFSRLADATVTAFVRRAASQGRG
jgi:ribosome-associated toxin RatA of RatAB toxin-antitoxin module